MSKLPIDLSSKLKPIVQKLVGLAVLIRKNTFEIANTIYLARKDREIYNVKEGDKLKDFLITNNVMSESAYSIFLTIGKNQYLQKPDIVKYLPIHQQSLYLIASKIQKDELKTLVDKKKITPSSTVEDINQIVNNLRDTKKPTSKKQTRLYTISIEYDDLKKHKSELKMIPIKILNLFPYLKITK